VSVATSYRRRLAGVVVVAAALAIWAPPGRAQTAVPSASTEEARAYADKATAAFALTHYAVAAENFEKAFELRPDPALLYNAAQSHRLAGNKQRALELYRSYLRLYAKKDKRAEIEARIAELEAAIARDNAVTTRPPNTTEPVGTPPAPGAAPPAPAAPPLPPEATPAPAMPLAVASAPPTTSAPTLVAQPQPAPQDESLVKKPWFWIATGAGVAVAVTVVLLLTMGGSSDPSPSIGRINAN
jgi:hypothetical protein